MTQLSGFEHLSGDEWQDLCVRVLHEQHVGAELVEVPDDDRGDAGLEAFSLSGCAYQCYAPEGEPLSTAARYRKQRDKMTADVGKFIKNADKLERLFPPDLKIARWAVLVPYINSRSLLEHAKKKTAEVRAAALTYAAPDIVVTALTLSAFEGAREAVINRQLRKLDIPPVESVDYSDIDDDLIGRMQTKLAMTASYADDERRGRIVDRFMKNFVAGRAHRDHVQDQYSELGDQLE